MRVEYDDPKLERLCTDDAWMRRKRADIAKKLPLRIKALEAANTVGELPTNDQLGKWHELTADFPGHWAGKVSDNLRLIIRPEGDGETWEAEQVTVVDITDYH